MSSTLLHAINQQHVWTKSRFIEMGTCTKMSLKASFRPAKLADCYKIGCKIGIIIIGNRPNELLAFWLQDWWDIGRFGRFSAILKENLQNRRKASRFFDKSHFRRIFRAADLGILPVTIFLMANVCLRGGQRTRVTRPQPTTTTTTTSFVQVLK